MSTSNEDTMKTTNRKLRNSSEATAVVSEKKKSERSIPTRRDAAALMNGDVSAKADGRIAGSKRKRRSSANGDDDDELNRGAKQKGRKRYRCECSADGCTNQAQKG